MGEGAHKQSGVRAWWAIGLLAAGAAQAAGPPGALLFDGPQLLLYATRTFGATPANRNHFGLRYERTSPAALLYGAPFAAPLRRHTLLDLQFTPSSATRLLLGPHATWDLSRRQLSPNSAFQDMPWRADAPRLASTPAGQRALSISLP